MPVEKEKNVARGGNRDSQDTAVPHRTPGDSSTSVPDTIEELDRLFQAVEGYRVGALNRAGLMHYYEIARQFRIAHPEIVRATESEK